MRGPGISDGMTFLVWCMSPGVPDGMAFHFRDEILTFIGGKVLHLESLNFPRHFCSASRRILNSVVSYLPVTRVTISENNFNA